MDPDLQLDPLNPPKYCPQCARSGLKSKVKKFKMDPSSSEVVIMCKNGQCPWPFSVQSQAGATVKTDCGADSPSATSTPSRPSSRKRKIKQKTATQDSNHEAEPPDIKSSSGNKKVKLDSSVNKSNSGKSMSEKPQENTSPAEELVKIPSGPTAPIAAVINDRKEVDGVLALAHGVSLESDQILSTNKSTSDEIIQEDALSNEDSNKPDADSSVKIPLNQQVEPQSDIPKGQGQVLVGIQSSHHETRPDNLAECTDDPTSQKQTSGIVPSSLTLSHEVVESPPAGIQTLPNQTLDEDQIPDKQILAKTQLPLKQASAVVLAPPLQASDVQTLAVKASPDVQTLEIEASPNVQTLAIQGPSCVDLLPQNDTSKDQIPPTPDPPEVQNIVNQALDVQKFTEHSPPDDKNTSEQADSDVLKTPLQSHLELPEVQNFQELVPNCVQNNSLQAPPYVQNSTGQVLPDVQNASVHGPIDVQNISVQAYPDVQNTPEHNPEDIEYVPAQVPPDVQNSPIKPSPDVQKTAVVQSNPEVQKTPIEAYLDVQNTPEETLDVQNTSVQANPDVQNISKQATPMQVPLDVQTPLVGSPPGLNTDPSPVAILSSSVCRKAVSLPLEPALEVKCEHAVLAASSLKLLFVNKIESQKAGQTAKRNEVITRSGRKIKPNKFHHEDEQGSKEASVTKNTTKLKNVMENVPALKPVSNIPVSEVKEVSKKMEGIGQIDDYVDVFDEDEDEKNLEEEKRIQSLIKPPYPRRRQRGRKAEKDVIPSLKSPSNKRSKASSKLDDKVVNLAKADNLNRSGKSNQIVATPNQNFPAPHLTHPELSEKSGIEAESLKSLKNDLIEKVTKVLEKQNKEAAKSLKKDCEDLPSNFSMVTEVSENIIERIVEDKDIQFLKPKHTFQRVKKVDKFIFQPSYVSEVIEVEKINLDVEGRQKESLIFCPVSFMKSSELRDVEDVLRLCTGVALEHMTERISDEEDDTECSLSEVVQSEPECGFETTSNESSEVSKVEGFFNIQSTQESFFWRGWTIDLKFMATFSDYLRKLINKWKPPKKIGIDPRIHVLLKEKEKNTGNPEYVLKMISFFSEVFVKYIYIKTNLPNLDSGKLLGLLKQCLAVENKQILKEIQIIKEGQKTETTAILQPSESTPFSKPVQTCTSSPNTSSCPPTAHPAESQHNQQVQFNLLTFQPLNLSTAVKVPVLQISTKVAEEEVISTEFVPIETPPDSEERNKPPTTQVKDLLDKENKRKRKDDGEVDRDSHFEEVSQIESNKSKKKKIKSIEKSKLYEKKFATSDCFVSENLSEENGSFDVLNLLGRKADINAGMKSRNIGVEIGNDEKLVEKAIKEEILKTENPIKKGKILSHGDGGILNKLLNTAKTKPTDTKDYPVDEKVNLVNKMGGSRRKNSTPAQVVTEVKHKKLKSPIDGTVSISSGIKQGEDVSKRQGNSSDSKLHFKTEEFSSASSSKIVQESLQVKACVAAINDGNASKGLGSFEQAFARKKQTEKIKKVLEIKKRKAEAGTSKKYKGFGEAVDPVQVVEKKKKKKEKKVKEIVKKAQVSKSEKDLMEELLSIADTAVAVAKSSPVMNKSTMDAASRKNPVDTSVVFEFEELQTLGGSMADEGNIVEDFDSLFEFQ